MRGEERLLIKSLIQYSLHAVVETVQSFLEREMKETPPFNICFEKS